MKTNQSVEREAIGALTNPMGIEGLEFIEYSTCKPQALGQALEAMGFCPIARHRSREVILYRQGAMNIVVNAHEAPKDEAPSISACAFKVRDAAAAYKRAISKGAWPVPIHVEPMELHIPAIHGAGSSRIYFVDRWREFSIWSVDFVPIPSVDQNPPALHGARWFGLVQYIGFERMADWVALYKELLGFESIPDSQRFGVLPSGQLLQSPCGLMLQLIEPDMDAANPDHPEYLQRVGIAVDQVLQATNTLQKRGVNFVNTSSLQPTERGALTEPLITNIMFELVRDPL